MPTIPRASSCFFSPRRMDTRAVPADADQEAEGQLDDHDGEGHGDAGDADGAHRAADEDPVDDGVESRDQHAHDGGDAELDQ